MGNIDKDMETLESYFKKAKSNSIAFEGYCHDCKKLVTVKVDLLKNNTLQVQGGSVYFPEIISEDETPEFFLKCEPCFKEDSTLRNYQPCDVYSRTVGFYRPVKSWNAGKQAEFKYRKEYDLPGKKKLEMEEAATN